jgi:hypothetical protein
MRWWKPSFRCSLFLLLSVPLAIWSLADRGVLQRRVAGALLAREPALSRVRGLAGVPVDLLALVVAGYCWTGVLLNLLYPIRPLLGMDGEYRDAWGGPTLAGAWAVHALGGLAFLLVVPWVLRGYVALWRRIAGA